MKKISLLITFLICYSVSPAQQQNRSYSVFIEEVKKFIDTGSMMSMYNGKYNVYYVKLFTDVNNDNDFCFMMTFVVNNFSYDDLSPSYAFNIGNNIVVLDLEKYSGQKWLLNSNYMHVDSLYKEKILNKFIPKEMGYGVGHPPALLFCYKKDAPSYKQFYNNVDNLPSQFQFLHKNPLPPGSSYKIDPPQSHSK